MNNKWIHEDINEIYEKWEKTRLLDGLQNKKATALFLEGQRRHNLLLGNAKDKLKRLSICMVRRIMGHLEEMDRENVEGVLTEQPYWTGTSVKMMEEYNHSNKHITLGCEADHCATACVEIAAAIDEFTCSSERWLGDVIILLNHIDINKEGSYMVNYGIA